MRALLWQGRLRRAALTGATGLAVGATVLPPPATAVGPHALTDLSQELLRLYNAGDGPALHGLLAPSLQAKYPVEDLHAVLVRCRVLTHDIFRFSTPSWGARRYGFFAVYAEAGTLEMILEIDEDEKILHWVITDDVSAADQQCSLIKPSDGADPPAWSGPD